jgi:hypothetical protein
MTEEGGAAIGPHVIVTFASAPAHRLVGKYDTQLDPEVTIIQMAKVVVGSAALVGVTVVGYLLAEWSRRLYVRRAIWARAVTGRTALNFSLVQSIRVVHRVLHALNLAIRRERTLHMTQMPVDGPMMPRVVGILLDKVAIHSEPHVSARS